MSQAGRVVKMGAKVEFNVLKILRYGLEKHNQRTTRQNERKNTRISEGKRTEKITVVQPADSSSGFMPLFRRG